MDELVFILLSAKTSERSYLRTYRALKARFPDWFAIVSAREGDVARTIASGGLSRKKEAQIRALLERILQAGGRRRLARLRRQDDEGVEHFLTGLPGIGLKSARCVMMYSLDRRVFPVDTHCRRILSRLGFSEFRRLTDAIQNDMQASVPPPLRYSLHVNLVAHGRRICLSNKPKCSDCPVRRSCQYFLRNRTDSTLPPR